MAIQNIDITDRSRAPQASGGCGCCGTPAEESPTRDLTHGDATGSYAVVGMTCSHCVGAVTDQLTQLPDVTGVHVDLVAGGTSTVTVTSTRPLSNEVVAAAVQESGYTLAEA